MRASLTLAAAVLLGVALSAGTANATCKRFGFTVNDYGKDGPTKDAKELLDKHIAEWAAQQGIKDYKTGSKTVNCELFLNFVVFDEHTCTASANVCWNDGKGKSTPETAAATPEDGEAVPPTPIRKAALMGHDKKTAATADAKAPPAAAMEAPPASPPAEEAATPPATPAAATTEVTAPSPPPAPPAEPAKAADMAPPSPPPGVVETGTLPKEPLTSLKQHAAADATSSPNTTPTPPPAAPTASASKKDPAAATAAATAAAAAAERAAVAAETAAAAAKEAAAAAVAASAASKGAVVPPLDGGP